MASNFFLSNEEVASLRGLYGSPIYVYSEEILTSQASTALNFPNNDGLIVRFAMKSCPNAAVLQIFDRAGLHFDASSGFEIHRAMKAGISPRKISLSSQEFPLDFADLYPLGIEFNACSLHQLKLFGELFPGASCGIRFNPGVGSGGTEKTNVGGPSSSFGIWHDQVADVKEIASIHGINIKKIHTHIGSGSDPSVWTRAAELSLAIIEQFPTAVSLNLGGGFKVARVDTEVSTDLQVVGTIIKELMADFTNRTGRALLFEIEPGTFLTANSGILLCTVQDVVSTGSTGYNFIKLDSGMTEILRPSMYGACHPISTVSMSSSNDNSDAMVDYVVLVDVVMLVKVGHCCESGDLITCKAGESSTLRTVSLPRVNIGDALLIGGAGAYCSSMSAKNYNSFPEAAEVLMDKQRVPHLIRRRQTIEQIIENEVAYISAP